MIYSFGDRCPASLTDRKSHPMVDTPRKRSRHDEVNDVGLLINIEAIDRAGKSTASKLVETALRERGVSIMRMAFPDRPKTALAPSPAHYSTGVLIDRYLSGHLQLLDGRDPLFRRSAIRELSDADRGEIATIVTEKLFQIICSINRRERYSGPDGLAAAIETYDVVLTERYLSAYTYGVAAGVGRAQILALESDLPAPDLTVLLDIDPSIARSRRPEDPSDIYESDLIFQAKVRELYLDLVRTDGATSEAEMRLPRFLRIDASIPATAVAALIVSAIGVRLGLITLEP